MKLILHIGNHKCGSTSIQHALLANRDTLLNASILYPNSGLIGCAHHHLPFSVRGQPTGFKTNDHPKSFEFFIQQIINEAKENDIDTIVVSSEEFMAFSIENIDAIKKYLVNFDSIVIIAYLRNQVDLIESAYKFNVLWEATCETISFEERIHNAVNRKYHEYDKRLEYWSRVHSNTEIVAKDFHQEIKNSLINSFFNEIDFITSPSDNSPSTTEKMNPSLTRLGTLLLRDNNKIPSLHSRKAIIQIIKKLENSQIINRKHKLYTLGTFNKISDRFSDSNQRLYDSFGVDLNESILNLDISLCMGEEYMRADQAILAKYRATRNITEIA